MTTDPSSWAGIIGAIAGLITALVGVPSAIVVLLSLRKKVEVVHKIVNQQRTDQQRFNIALQQQLLAAGIKPVVDQSLPVTGYEDATPATKPATPSGRPLAGDDGTYEAPTGSSLDPRPKHRGPDD